MLRKPGSVGPPSPGVDLRLSDGGEILLRSAYLFDGYFDDPNGRPAYKRHLTHHFAEEIRAELAGARSGA